MAKQKDENKTLCKCLACGKRFDIKDAAQKPVFSVTKPACPFCKSERFTILKLANPHDDFYIRTSKGQYRGKKNY